MLLIVEINKWKIHAYACIITQTIKSLTKQFTSDQICMTGRVRKAIIAVTCRYTDPHKHYEFKGKKFMSQSVRPCDELECLLTTALNASYFNITIIQDLRQLNFCLSQSGIKPVLKAHSAAVHI